MQRRAALMDVVEDLHNFSLCGDSPGSNGPLLLLCNYTKVIILLLGRVYVYIIDR